MAVPNPRDEFSTETAYNESFDQVYGWSQNPAAQPDTSHQQMVPVQPSPPPIPAGAQESLQADRDRRATTVRIAIALAMAIPLTAIAAGVGTTMGGPGPLLMAALTWFGIATVVTRASGRGFPRR